jgi:hypothetical protein
LNVRRLGAIMHENEATLRCAQDIIRSVFARHRASSAFLQAGWAAVSRGVGMALGHHQLLAVFRDSSSSVTSIVWHSSHLGRTRGFQKMEETLISSPNNGAAGNSRRPFSFVRFIFHKVICSGHGRPPAAVPELGR